MAESAGLAVGSSVLLASAMSSDEEANVTFQSRENGTSPPTSWLPKPKLAGTLGESLVALQVSSVGRAGPEMPAPVEREKLS